MGDTNSSDTTNQNLTYQEKVQLRKKFTKLAFKTVVLPPLIGTCILVVIVILLGNSNSQTDAVKSGLQLFMYACSISLLWLIYGIYRYWYYMHKLPKVSPELSVSTNADSGQNIKSIKMPSKIQHHKDRFLRRLKTIVAVIIIVLIITNPSVKDFKDYIGTSSYSGLSRKQNWLIFSVYEYDYHNYSTSRYIAVFMNFFRI